MPAEVTLYAAAYAPRHRQEQNQIEAWLANLAVGSALPLLPLPIRGYRFIDCQ